MQVYPIGDDLLYVAVPKAGATSVKRMLVPWSGLEGEPPDDDDRFHEWFGHSNVTEVELDDLRRDRRVFTLVRHPVERFESFVYDKLRVPVGTAATALATGNHRGWPHKSHWVPQAWLIGRDLSRYALLGHLEDVPAFERDLSRLMGVPMHMPRSHASHRGRHLTGRAREVVVRYYREDFKLLGYDPAEEGAA